ncbi:MAG: glycerate kinase [Bacteroidota bacterium]
MKFVIAPDKYKGSLTGLEFCDAVEQGIQKVFPKATILKKPLADGGDGTISVVKYYLKASEVLVEVNDPLFRKTQATYLLSGDKKVAFIEMSEASGYKLLSKKERNCSLTTTLGTGQLIAHALDNGVTAIVLGIGGSATNDGGIGMATALGYRFLDQAGDTVQPVGQDLGKIAQIDRTQVHSRLGEVKIKVACDVNNPLYGPNGAAHVYGPQKGASGATVDFLDSGLRNLADVILAQFEIDVQQVSGAGAAGGMGAGALVFLNAVLASGVDLVKEMAHFDDAIDGADWIITGEGQLDGQTLSGKTIAGALESARAKQIPVAAFCGAVALSMTEIETMGLQYVTSILNQVGTLEQAKKDSYANLMLASFNFARLLQSTAP